MPELPIDWSHWIAAIIIHFWLLFCCNRDFGNVITTDHLHKRFTPTAHWVPVQSSTWRWRHCRTVWCQGKIENIINILIIHLKSIKTYLGIKECQAKQKSSMVMLCGHYLYHCIFHQQNMSQHQPIPPYYCKCESGHTHTSVADPYQETSAIACIFNVSQKFMG